MRARSCVVACAMVFAAACSTPIKPDPIDPGPIVNNTPPTVGAFRVQGSRASEPPSFADLNEEVEVSVAVTDPESQIADLKFVWSSTAGGTFTGSGAKVIWKAPAQAVTPVEVTINLEVVETYTSAGKATENKVSSSTKLMLHDSVTEVGEMARRFLLDFSDSSNRDVANIMRNFEPSCYGTASETSDVTANREWFFNLSYDIGLPATTVAFGGICPRREKGPRSGDACSLTSARWTTKFVKDDPASGHSAGDTFEARGIAQIAAVYYPAQKRWRLCDSTAFEAGNTLGITLKGLLP